MFKCFTFTSVAFLTATILAPVAQLSAQEKLVDCADSRARTNAFTAMACNIFEEAQAESFEGKLAVGYGTINRVKHPAYPKTIPAVVWQRGQYDWTTKARAIYARAGVRKQWEDSVHAAMLVLIAQHRTDYERLDFTHGAVNFHARGDVNIWPSMIETTKVGAHRFFADKRGLRKPLPPAPPVPRVTAADFANETDYCVIPAMDENRGFIPLPREL